MFSTIQSHSDLISSIDFCVKNEKTYVIIASSDCSVSLNELNGTQVGIFGQEEKWKMDQNLSARQTPSLHLRLKSNTHQNKSNINQKHLQVPIINVENTTENLKTFESNEDETELPVSSMQNLDICFLPGIDKKLTVESTFKYENDAFIKDTTLRYNPWSKTILGQIFNVI